MHSVPRSNPSVTCTSSPINIPSTTSVAMRTPAASPSVPVDSSLADHLVEPAASGRRASVGTASTVSLDGSTSSSESYEHHSGQTRKQSLLSESFKHSVSERASFRASMAPSMSIWNDAMKEDQELQSVRALLHRVLSTLNQSVAETQLSSFLSSDLKPFASILHSSGSSGGGGGPPDADDVTRSSSPHRQSLSTGPGGDHHSMLKSSTPNSSVINNETSPGSMKLSKRESLKVQKRNYRHEKHRATKELLGMLKDSSVVIIADWLKVRGSLKSWTKLYCVLKPGVLVLYKSHKAKSSHWIGTVMLNSCELLERPSKKDGFCFKVFHPLNQSIWATKGPKGENIGAITLPLPYSHLIFRAYSEAAGKCWMDALELALRCSNLLMRSITRGPREPDDGSSPLAIVVDDNGEATNGHRASLHRRTLDESDCERHFNGIDDDVRTDREDRENDSDNDEFDDCAFSSSAAVDDILPPVETTYVENTNEELGQQGEACQTEEVADDNKSLIWTLVKQVRPGMDLSKVVLPTFILEPRSFLDKLSDYYYHVDFLSRTNLEDDPFTRIKQVVRFYLSGFYKKPKGLKKPYNPVIGEVFRCNWRHPSTGSRTFYIAEQISHHPPVSAFYVTNRQEGFVFSGCILAKSKFYGNSLSAIMDGSARLMFLTRGEEYVLTMPYAHCKGILIGTLTMEFGGLVTIKCEKTGYNAELDFKLKPFLGSDESSNRIIGRIKLGTETLATISGHWDQEVHIVYKGSGETQLFWNPNAEMKALRLRRSTVPVGAQADFESEKLWLHVSEAITAGDIQAATNEKFLVEEEQRKLARERKMKMLDWVPKLFERNLITGDWVYKYADLRPWDAMNDVVQYEHDMVIQTKTRHQTPIVRATSVMHIDDSHRHCRSLSLHLGSHRSSHGLHSARHNSGSSTPDGSLIHDDRLSAQPADARLLSSDDARHLAPVNRTSAATCHAALQKLLEPLVRQQLENANTLNTLVEHIYRVETVVRGSLCNPPSNWWNVSARDVVLILFAIFFQAAVLHWLRQ